MKRFLSWIVLWIGVIVSVCIINIVVYIGLHLAARIYDTSRGIFWLILFVGGSFGLGLAYYISMFASTICVSISEKVSTSLKGTRYIVAAIILSVYSVIEIIYCFLAGFTGILLAKQVVADIIAIGLGFFLFSLGKGGRNKD